MLLIKWPLEATYLLLMTLQTSKIVVLLPKIPLQYGFILRPWTEYTVAPGDCADTPLVAFEDPEHLALVDVPDLHDATVGADRQVLPPLRPADRSHWVALAQVMQLRHLAVTRWPDVDAVRETHRQVVVRRPVHQVQVEVVLQGGGVQHFVRDFRNLPRSLARYYDLIFIKSSQWMMMSHTSLFIKISDPSIGRRHGIVVLGLRVLWGSGVPGSASEQASTEIHKVYLWSAARTLQKIWQTTKSRRRHTRRLVIIQPESLLLILLRVESGHRRVISGIRE